VKIVSNLAQGVNAGRGASQRSCLMDSMTDRFDDQELNIVESDLASKPTPRVPGQRDPDKTRRAILDAATEEFIAKGFAGASVNEIADRANVNKRMLYHYFGKKDELYVAVLERVYFSLRSAQTQKLKVSDLSPVQAIEALIKFTWKYYIEHPEFLNLMMIENMQQGRYALQSERISGATVPLRELMQEVVKRGQDEGVFREDVDSFQLYLTIGALGATHIATRHTLSGLVGEDLTTPEQLDIRVHHITDVVLGYLRP
jgi:AcrR family transcriptional regulator